MAEAEGDDPLLGDRAELVGHARRAPLAGSQHLEPGAQHRCPPAVVGRGVDPEDATRGPNVAELPSQAEQAQPEAIQDVILDHGAPTLLLIV